MHFFGGADKVKNTVDSQERHQEFTGSAKSSHLTKSKQLLHLCKVLYLCYLSSYPQNKKEPEQDMERQKGEKAKGKL